MGSLTKSRSSWWKLGYWNVQPIICQKVDGPFKTQDGWWEGEPFTRSPSSMMILAISIILSVTTATLFFLRPLRMPFTSQMIGGVLIVGLLFSNQEIKTHVIVPYMMKYVLKTLSFLGFMFHSLMLGVETNMSSLIKTINKKSAFISISGFFLSLTFSFISLLPFVAIQDWADALPLGFGRLAGLNAQTFFMVTCNNLNDLGMSNSELGRLACAVSLVIDISGMVVTFLLFELLPPFVSNGARSVFEPLSVIAFYAFVFLVCRPVIIHIVDQCSEPHHLEPQQLATIVLIVVLISGVGELMGQMFAVFVFALSLPEDPLSSILTKKLDAMTFGVFFPIYCAMQGELMDIPSLEPATAFRIEINLILGSIGKFVGTYASSLSVGLPLKKALALSLIMSSKGLFDIVSLGLWANSNLLDVQEYTVAAFHFLVCSGFLLPLVRRLYNPSSEYATILGSGVMDINENGALKTLACIHNEENVPGVVRLIESFDPSRTRPIPLMVLQLIQLTGRVSMPVLGLLDQVRSSRVLAPKLARCDRIVESLSYLERKHKGYIRLQHFISVASCNSMHNDVCNLAYERGVSLLILPFHVNPDAKDDTKNSKGNSALTIRTLNKMILQKSPCAVGILIDRSNTKFDNFRLHDPNQDGQVYRIAIIYIGGMDDREALAYVNLFATNPNVSVMICWLKSSRFNDDRSSFDFEVISTTQANVRSNQRISMNEISVEDGAETTNFLLNLKDKVDLIVAGRYHEPKCGPLFGLSDGWAQYSELGILGDLLASSDFGFSVLIVQSSVEDQYNKM